MNDIMLDLETMSTEPNAAIVAIGAVAFDSDSGKLGAEFYRGVSLTSSMQHGGHVSASTILWWMGQGDAARDAIIEGGYDLVNALMDFALYLDQFRHDSNGKIRIWGNGSDFDNVILASAYKACNLQIPWQFWENRCFRTAKALRPEIRMVRSGTHHKALDDAKTQAQYLIKIMRANDL